MAGTPGRIYSLRTTWPCAPPTNNLKSWSRLLKPFNFITTIKNPALIGGPFMDHPTESTDEVTQLIEHARHQTSTACRH